MQEDVVSFEDEPRPSPHPRWFESTLGRLRPWVEWFGAGRLLATGLTVLAVVIGGWWLLRAPTPPTEAGLPFARASTSGAATVPTPPSASTVPARLVVHVAGAVAHPGIYELAGDARVHVAIEAAGGALPEASPGSLNLAAPLTDGERVYVPLVGEVVPPPAQPGSPSSPPGPLDLNRATAEELDDLPGIGPATAAAIVDHRANNGPFASVDDLEAVRGIGPAKLDAIRELVRV
jgi:competence protein ComEA